MIKSLEKDIIPVHFGFGTISRQDLIENETSIFAKELFNADKKLILIFDGIYVFHQRSSTNEYQRKSYSDRTLKMDTMFFIIFAKYYELQKNKLCITLLK